MTLSKRHAALAALLAWACIVQAHGDTAFGRVGDPAKATRTIRVDMADTMRFTPDDITAKRGETVKLVARNKGKVLHELVLGTADELKKHAELMRKFPGMEHEEPHMTHVKPGRTGEIVRRLDKAQGKMTLRRGPLPSLAMPAMTMVFKVADSKMLDGLKEGDKVRFAADRVDSTITVTAIEVVR